MSEKKGLKAYTSVQQLRAIAALGVVVFHIASQTSRMGYEGYWPNFLSSGVDVFFAISGFIMWVTTYGKPTTPQKFIVNRLIRIVPLYWLVTTFALLILLINPNWMQSGALDWSHVVKSYLFIPATHPVKTETMEPLVFAGWTLNLELMFYVIFALALLLKPPARLLITLTALVLISCLRFAFPAKGTIIWFYSSDIILEFGFGMLIGWFIVTGRTLPTLVAVALVLLGATALAVSSAWDNSGLGRSIVRGIPAAAIVLGAVCCEVNGRVLKAKFLGYLGDASYSIYLVHGILLSAFAQIWWKIAPAQIENNILLFTLLSIFASCAGSIVIYELVEKKISNFLKSRGAAARQRGLKEMSSNAT